MAFQLGILFGVVALLGWGLSDFFGAYVSRKATPLRSYILARVFSLVLVSLVTIFALFFFKALFFPASFTLSPAIVALALAIGLSSALAGVSYFKAMTVGDLSVVTPVSSVYPAFVVLISVFFLGEKLTNLQVIAIVCAIIGSLLISFKLKDLSKLDPRRAAKGVNYALFTAFCWTFMVLFIGILAKQIGWFLPILFLNITAVFYFIVYSKAYKKDISLPKKHLVLLLICSSLCDVIGFLAYSVGATVTYISIVATVSSMYPAVLIVMGIFFFKERPDVNQWFGVLLVLAGLVLLSV